MDLSNIPCWLIPLVVGFICSILGFLVGRFWTYDEKTDIELDLWKRKNASLQVDLENCRSKLNDKQIFNTSIPSSLTTNDASSKESTIPFDAIAVKAIFNKTIIENDLTVIEGIGPKIKELFHNFDIKTWDSLAITSIEKCQEVLKSGGKRFEIHKPDTWPMQATLAAQRKWQELKKWQDENNYGKSS